MVDRPAARLLLLEAAAIEPILQAADDAAFDRPTICDGWSVRDVMAHCAAALTRTASGDLHSFSPEDNQADVDARRGQSVGQVLAELITGYEAAALAIDEAGGALDGVGLGEWMHGGDIRDALGVSGAYESEGIDLALELLVDRSRAQRKPGVLVRIGDRTLRYGVGEPTGSIATDAATFVRICGGRSPDSELISMEGDVDLGAMALFS